MGGTFENERVFRRCSGLLEATSVEGVDRTSVTMEV